MSSNQGTASRVARSLLLSLIIVSFAGTAARADIPYHRAGWTASIPPGSHAVQGLVTIIDERTLHVENFTYDGGGPSVYFYLGATDTDADFENGLQIQPLLTGTVYNDDTLTLTLPPGETLEGYGAISVWCEDFSVNFSSAEFLAPDFPYPRAGWIANIPPGLHAVQGKATIINERVLHVEDFTYDGGGPAVYFYLGATDSHADFVSGLGIPPLLTGTVFAGDSVVVGLPAGANLDGYGAISVWCVDFSVSFSSASFEAPPLDPYDYAAFFDCLAGPDAQPAPTSPASPQDCLDVFDCDHDSDIDLADFSIFQIASRGVPTQTALYEFVFDSTWSAATHPVDFPSGAHFSGPIGGTHDGSISFWEIGGLATPGIEDMAETGSKTALTSEVEDAIAAGSAGQVISASGLASPGGVSLTQFTATTDFPLATVVSMIAPSPDWFVGVSGFSLLHNGQWIEQAVIPLYPYDAGTDSGPTYTSPNDDTVPQEPITEITGPPLEHDGAVAPLGTFLFQRLDTP